VKGGKSIHETLFVASSAIAETPSFFIVHLIHLHKCRVYLTALCRAPALRSRLDSPTQSSIPFHHGYRPGASTQSSTAFHSRQKLHFIVPLPLKRGTLRAPPLSRRPSGVEGGISVSTSSYRHYRLPHNYILTQWRKHDLQLACSVRLFPHNVLIEQCWWLAKPCRHVYRRLRAQKAGGEASRLTFAAVVIILTAPITGLVPWLGYHHVLMLLNAVAMILLCMS